MTQKNIAHGIETQMRWNEIYCSHFKNGWQNAQMS